MSTTQRAQEATGTTQNLKSDGALAETKVANKKELANDYYTSRTLMELAEFPDCLVKPMYDYSVRKEKFLTGSLHSYQFSVMSLQRDRSNLSL